MTTKFPDPPEGRFGKWAYMMWDYLAKNRSGAAIAFSAGSGIVVGTGTGGTYTLAEGTSGVAPGTYSQVTVDALGRVTVGGTAAGVVWQPNQSYIPVLTTRTVGTGTNIVIAGELAIQGSTGSLLISGTGNSAPGAGRVHII